MKQKKASWQYENLASVSKKRRDSGEIAGVQK
jgi:hypothetical protein